MKRFVKSTGWLVPALVIGVAATVPGLSEAQIAHPGVVKTAPVSTTPHLASNTVISSPAAYSVAQLGSTMYVGGRFNAIANPARTVTYTRYNIVAFDAATGAVSTSFVPNFNSNVWAIVPSGGYLYVGGQFSTVNGVARRALVKVNASTGAIDSTFKPYIPWGNVYEVRLVNGRLIIGGSFPKRLAALDPATGKDTGYINLSISGKVADNAGATDVYRFAVNPQGDRLVAIGNFTSVAGQTRYRAFMLDLGTTAGTLNPWYYQQLTKMCAASSLPAYLRDVDFSPDGNYFVMVSTGWVSRTGDLGLTVCDATARFETYTNPNPLQPTWINYTGGDTLHSVAVTGAAVYVNGHQRWLDNPNGKDTCVTTCVSRPGIGAIDPATGRALAWNPTKTRAVGGKDLLATSTGLWVMSDGKYFNGKYRWGIAFVPL